MFWPITPEAEFARYGNSGEILMTVLVFILHHFQEKRIIIFSKKIQKTLLRGYFKSFGPKFWRKLIIWEKEALNIAIIYHRTKNPKKLMTHS